MKKSIKLFIVILLASINIFSVDAQSFHRRRIYGDFFAGMTFANMDISGANEFKKNKIGFMIGANVNYRFYSSLHLQSGFYIIKKGNLQHEDRIVDQDGPQEKRDIKTTVDANYVQIPLNIGFEIPIKKDIRINMYGGGFAALGFKGESKVRGYKALIVNGSYQESTSVDDGPHRTFSNTNLKKLDYGLSASVGIVYDIFVVRLQYDHGLANVASDALASKNSGKRAEWKTRNYALCLGFRF